MLSSPYHFLIFSMLVIQPLIQGLRGLNLYSKVYEGKDGFLKLEVGKTLNSFWRRPISTNLIFGNLLTKGDIIYTLKEDSWEKKIISPNIGEFDIAKIERLLNLCYNFEETHKVTEYKN